MISAIAAIAVGLGVFSDDDSVDYNELVQRALLLGNPKILLGSLNEEQKGYLKTRLIEMAAKEKDFERAMEIHRLLDWLFLINLTRGEVRVSETDVIGGPIAKGPYPYVGYKAELFRCTGKMQTWVVSSSFAYKVPEEAIKGLFKIIGNWENEGEYDGGITVKPGVRKLKSLR